jgi:hypothetical protein
MDLKLFWRYSYGIIGLPVDQGHESVFSSPINGVHQFR